MFVFSMISVWYYLIKFTVNETKCMQSLAYCLGKEIAIIEILFLNQNVFKECMSYQITL